MRTLDFTIQVLLILLGMSVALHALMTPNVGVMNSLIFVQLFLGAYQILSALLNLIEIKKQEKWFRQKIYSYLSFTAAYFVLIYSIIFLDIDDDKQMEAFLEVFVVGVLPWSLAIYYFLICGRKLAFLKKVKRHT